MICKKCGTYNEDYLEYCENCSSLLTGGSVSSDNSPFQAGQAGGGASDSDSDGSSWRFAKGPMWPDPVFDANSVSDKDIPEDNFSFRETEPSYDTYYQEPEPEPVYRQERPVRSDRPRQPYSSQQQRPSRPSGSGSSQRPAGRPSSNSEFFDNSSRTRGKKRKKANRGRLIFVGVAALLIVAIVVFLMIGIFGGGLSSLFGGSKPLAEPYISKTGEPGYLITIKTKTGNGVRVVAPRMDKTFVAENTNVPMFIPETAWLPTTPVETATIEVVPDITIIDKDGKETKVEIEPITINVPALTLNVTEPAGETFTATSQTITFSGTVSNPGATVTVNETAMTVDQAGNFTGYYALDTAAGASQQIVVKAAMGGHQTASKTITVEGTPTGTAGPTATPTPGITEQTANGAITLADTFDIRTDKETLKVTGKVTPGSTITVSGAELSGNPTVDTQGAYSFTVKFPSVGKYDIVITSTLGANVSTKSVMLLRAPVKSEYTSSAHKFDYDRILSSDGPQAYELKAKIIESIQTSPYKIVKAEVSGKIVYLEYFYKYALDVGKTYNIWANPHGKYSTENSPLMTVWFIIDA